MILPFEASQHEPGTALITHEGETLTYGDMGAFSGFLSKVIDERCIAFCLCSNTPGSLLGYMAFLANRVVPVMLDEGTDADILTGLLHHYKPRYIWLPDSRVGFFTDVQVVFSRYQYSLLKVPGNDIYPLHKNLALLLATSGSTGSSKFIRISYENLESNAASIAEYLSIDRMERPVTTLPMSYSYGLSVINSHILKGASILLTTKSIVEKTFWDFVSAFRATSIAGVPYTYRILDKLHLTQMELPALKTLTQAGGKLNEELHMKFAKYCLGTGRKFFVMYGQTEATARISYLPPQYAIDKPGSIGVAIPGGEISLIDEQGNSIKENDVIGEIVYKGKNVSMGYADNIDHLSKGDENLGILHTGDLARRDGDGCYFITGRKSRFIKLFGHRISLDETERLLEQVIPECACTGMDDRMIIHITDRGKADMLSGYLSEKIHIHHSAFSFICCDKIPRNAAGKTEYQKLNVP